MLTENQVIIISNLDKFFRDENDLFFHGCKPCIKPTAAGKALLCL
jgi:hypothetical protein